MIGDLSTHSNEKVLVYVLNQRLRFIKSILGKFVVQYRIFFLRIIFVPQTFILKILKLLKTGRTNILNRFFPKKYFFLIMHFN